MGPGPEGVGAGRRRAEVDRLNSACQELGRPGARLGGDSRSRTAVGCVGTVAGGQNAIGELGGHGAVGRHCLHPGPDLNHLPGWDRPPDCILPRCWSLDGRRRRERTGRVDLAYATTGDRPAQGLTGAGPPARPARRHEWARMCSCPGPARNQAGMRLVGPEPRRGGEPDLPDREQPDGYLQLAQALPGAGGQTLAMDTPTPARDLRRLSTAELRAERDRLRRQPRPAPRDRTPSWPGRPLTASRPRPGPPTSRPPAANERTLRCLRRGGDQPSQVPGGLAVAARQADRAHDREREPRQHQQRRQGWLVEASPIPPAVEPFRGPGRRRRATGLCGRGDRPRLRPGGTGAGAGVDRGRRAWRHAAAEISKTGAPTDH